MMAKILTSTNTWTNVFPSTTYAEKYAGIYVPKRALDRWQQAMKPWMTTLSAAMTNSQTTMSLVSLDGTPQVGKFRGYIESEQVFVTAGAGTNTWTITRAVNSTTAATHAIGTPVYGEAIMRVIVSGDSTAESSIGGGGGVTGGGSGGDGWVTRLSRILSRISGIPLLSPPLGGGGFFGVWRNGDANIGGGAGNSATDWSCPSGAWTLVTAGGPTDRAPWGWAVTANGATNILRFTPPAYLGNILCVDVYFIEGGVNGWSYDVNNSGTWVNGGGQGAANGAIHRIRVTSGAAITDFRIRAAGSGGAALTPRIVGVEVWNTAPTYAVTQGLRIANFGKDSDFLGQFDRTNASGDNFALFDGDPGSLQPDLVILGPFTNDLLTGSGTYALYGTRLADLVNRFKPYCDVILVAFSEQNRGTSTDQATLRNWIHTTAQNLGVAYLDMYDAFAAQGIVGWTAANTEGYHGGPTSNDPNHYGPLGHQEMASRFDRMLTSF